jgi:hypothetical protein
MKNKISNLRDALAKQLAEFQKKYNLESEKEPADEKLATVSLIKQNIP